MADTVELYQELHRLKQRVAGFEAVETRCEELEELSAKAVKDAAEWKQAYDEANATRQELADALKDEREKKSELRKQLDEKSIEADQLAKKVGRLDHDIMRPTRIRVYT